jgi:ATP-dependent protease ClpP protease subunit
MEILVYGVVGDSCDGLEASWLVERISHAPDDITVRINSLGGLVFDGFAIFNALKQSPRRVIVHIDGVAGSIASIIAMAGDEIIMAENAVMMIHKPSDGTYGVATELRSTADRLDMLQAQLVNIYAQRTGMSADELNPLLDAETWLTAAEALDLNFIDSIAGASTATNMLDPSRFGFRQVPVHPLITNVTSNVTAAAVIAPTQETAMPDGTTAADATTATTTSTSPGIATQINGQGALATVAQGALATVAPAQPTNIADAVNAALAVERTRASTIRNEVGRARLDASFADTLINENVSIDTARQRIIDQIATAAPVITNFSPAMIPTAQFQARADAMSVAIANRANPRNQLTDDARHFAGRRLIVLARDFLESTGVSTRNMGDVQVAQAVFHYQQPRNAGQHTTADFPALMGNTVGRTLRRAYDLAPQTFKPFTRQSSVPDFREVARVALSDISKMQQVAEGAEYQYATVGDSSEKYVVGKWGQIISLTWETIINDDLSAFDRIPMAMGQEASQVESDVVWAIMLSNPPMNDSTPLFHADHGNLGAAADISIDSLQAGRTRMRTQKSSAGRFLNNAPSFLITGPLKEQQANQYTSANYVAAKNGDINPDYNRSLTPIVEGRILDKTWLLAADPNAQAIDTIEYAYLAGHEGLQTEQRQGFVTDGVDIKARLVFGAKALDWRGLDKTQSQ